MYESAEDISDICVSSVHTSDLADYELSDSDSENEAEERRAGPFGDTWMEQRNNNTGN